MYRLRGLTKALLLALLWATVAGAEERRLELDPEETEITFELGATLHTVHGTARLSEGVVVFDPETGAASGELVVEAGTAETGNENRDEDMHRKVLESEVYPEISFRPTAFRGELDWEGESRVELDGTLAIHGDEHPLTLEAPVDVDGQRVEATIEFEVPYVAWGMKDPSKFLLKVDKKVTVRVFAVGTVAPPDIGRQTSAESVTPLE